MILAIVLGLFFTSVTVNLIFWDINKELGAELDSLLKEERQSE